MPLELILQIIGFSDEVDKRTDNDYSMLHNE